MATPVENPAPNGPEGGTGAPESGAPAQEPAGTPAAPPAGTETPPQAPSPDGLPGSPAPDGTQVSGRGSHQDRPQTPADPAATPSPQGQPGTPPAGDQAPRQEVSELPDWAQKIIKDARDDAAKARTGAKATAAEEARKAMAEDIGRALGIITDETPAEDKLSPDQLKDLLAGERTTAKSARVELAVFKAAQGGGGFNAAALLDSRAFLDSIKDVDPGDAEALATKIAAAVEAQPWLAQQAAPSTPEPTPATVPGQAPAAPVAPVPPVAPPSGGQFAGGPGAQPQDLSTMSIDDFRKLRRTSPR